MSGKVLRNDVIALAALLGAAVLGSLILPNNLALLTHIIAVAFLVLSLQLVTGLSGVATLGQAALFGAGAYAAAIACVHYGVTDPLLMTFAGMAGGALAGLISGLVMVRAHGLSQLVLSIALVSLAHELANKASSWTGGSDGLSGISPAPLLGAFEFDLWGRTAYWYGVALLVITFVALRVLTRSPFGMVCGAIRQNSVRVRAMGASPARAIVALYVIAGAVAGIGGALAAISTQVVGLDSLSFSLSAEALVMLVLGGAQSLTGALVGTALFMLLEHFVSAANPFHWLTIVGAVLIATVLFAPRGIIGTLVERRRAAP